MTPRRGPHKPIMADNITASSILSTALKENRELCRAQRRRSEGQNTNLCTGADQLSLRVRSRSRPLRGVALRELVRPTEATWLPQHQHQENFGIEDSTVNVTALAKENHCHKEAGQAIISVLTSGSSDYVTNDFLSTGTPAAKPSGVFAMNPNVLSTVTVGNQFTPSPKGILKYGGSYSCSPRSKSISFGGTFYSPSPEHSGQNRRSSKTGNIPDICIAPRRKAVAAISPLVSTTPRTRSSPRNTIHPLRKCPLEEACKDTETGVRTTKKSDSNSPANKKITMTTSGKRSMSGGCSCKGRCDPSTCSCALNEIFCMVENQGFPCACSEIGCGNQHGRRQYDPLKIHAHYQATLERMQKEKNQSP